MLWPLTAWGEGKFTLSGFVDASFFYENLRHTNTLSLDEGELDIQTELQSWAGLRTDINFRFGKFNAPIGWELLDPVDAYQFSRSRVFNFGTPSNITGALLAFIFTPVVDLQLYAVNGWDRLRDNKKRKTFSGRLGLTPIKDVNWSLSLITGPEQDDNDDDYQTVFDTDLTIQLIPSLVIGVEFNYGWEKNAALGVGMQSGVKQNPIQEIQGQLLGMSQSSANEWIHLLHPVLNQALANQELLPARTAEEFAAMFETHSADGSSSIPIFGMMALNVRFSARPVPKSNKNITAARSSVTRSKTSS